MGARLIPDVTLHWREWDGEYVVFDEASGRTHQLDALTACVLLCVEEGVSDPEALIGRVAEHADLDHESVTQALPAILEQLAKAALIETIGE